MVQLSQLVESLESSFRLSASEANSIGMSKYMKGHFSFFGIKAEKRKEIQHSWLKQILKESPSEFRWELLKELFNKEEREFQYVAIDWLNTWDKKEISASDSEGIKWLITNKSWWDSVDSIASNFLGKYCQLFPDAGSDLIEKWRFSDNLWLQRSCLIFQLKYKEKVNFTLLKSLIVQFQMDKEFFIQKAIGWSLRQYSKSDPEAVRKFVEEIQLKGLAKREAIKYI